MGVRGLVALGPLLLGGYTSLISFPDLGTEADAGAVLLTTEEGVVSNLVSTGNDLYWAELDTGVTTFAHALLVNPVEVTFVPADGYAELTGLAVLNGAAYVASRTGNLPATVSIADPDNSTLSGIFSGTSPVVALVGNPTKVIFVDETGTVQTLDGSFEQQAAPLPNAPAGSYTALAADDADDEKVCALLTASPGDAGARGGPGDVWAIPLDGTSPAVHLAANQASPTSLAVNANAAFWVTTDASGESAIESVPLTSPMKLAAPRRVTSRPVSLVADGDYLYWVGPTGEGPAQAVYAMKIAGGAQTAVTTTEDAPAPDSSLAIDANALYWSTTSNAIERLSPKPTP